MDKTNFKKQGEKKEEKKTCCEEYKSKYLRALADYQNLEKRTQEEHIELRDRITAQACAKLLPFLDNLDAAEAFVKDPNLKLIRKNFIHVLHEMGIQEIEVFNKPFDPYTSEAVDVIEGKENDVVVEVTRKGYAFKGNVLRVAQVKVSKKIGKG